MSHAETLVILGAGFVGKELIRQASGSRHILASTRNPNRMLELYALGVEPLIMPLPAPEVVESVCGGADVLVSFPPDGESDALLAPACSRAKSLIYISSTGVYGKKSGKINENTEPDSEDQRMTARLAAESVWREHGAVVLRASGIYGSESGLHTRLLNPEFKVPASGANLISRIHVEDLCRLILAIFQDPQKLKKNTYVLADDEPATLDDVILWLCSQMDINVPETASPDDLSPTLKGNRAVDGTCILKELGLKLKYPGYREGYRKCLSENAARVAESKVDGQNDAAGASSIVDSNGSIIFND